MGSHVGQMQDHDDSIQLMQAAVWNGQAYASMSVQDKRQSVRDMMKKHRSEWTMHRQETGTDAGQRQGSWKNEEICYSDLHRVYIMSWLHAF